jgi:hypothetical protein
VWGFIDYYKDYPGTGGFNGIRDKLAKAISGLDERNDPAVGKGRGKQ